MAVQQQQSSDGEEAQAQAWVREVMKVSLANEEGRLQFQLSLTADALAPGHVHHHVTS